MNVLDYLVPSRTRREILKTLRHHPTGLTVRQLSRQARVAYSNAYREVGQMKRVGLVRTKRSGNALLCSWDARNRAARVLTTLLGKPTSDGSRRVDEENLYGNLKRWGAPLVRTGVTREPLSLEETLTRALALARRHPDVARVWPVVLAKNRSEVNLSELEFLARRLGSKKALGFFLALSQRLLKDSSLGPTVKRLRDRRVHKTEDFFLLERSKRAQRLAEENTPQVAKEWFFSLNMPLESFQSLFDKFVPRG